MNFGETLRNLMDERELTQKQLALALNIAQSTLGGYVQSTREPDFETLKAIASYFGVSTDYLLSYQGELLLSQNENELLRIFRSLNKEQQALYMEQGKVFVRWNHRNNEEQK